MRIIISESRLYNIILDYINKNYYPDYGWEDSTEFYRNEVMRHKEIDFRINEIYSYAYYLTYGFDEKVLHITSRVEDELTDLFGNKWVPVFKDWFEKNTGLTVSAVFTTGRLI